MTRMVQCVKLGRELPGLANPPMPSELGTRIYENVSQEGWQLWAGQSSALINHYSLNLLDPRAREFLNQQMEAFFFGEAAQMPADWESEQQAGKGGGKGAAPPAKGGKGGSPAPRGK